MFGKLREATFKRNVRIEGEYSVKRFCIETGIGAVRRLKKDGTVENKRSLVLRPGSIYRAELAASIDPQKIVLEGSICPKLASLALCTLSHQYLTPADAGELVTPTIVIQPFKKINVIELPYGVRWFTEFFTYPSWD